MFATVSGAIAASARAETSHAYDLPAQPMAKALSAFARTSGVRLAYSAALTRGLAAPALRGTYNRDAALDHLLAGSGLVHRIDQAGIVSILDKSAAGFMAQGAPVQLDEINVDGRGRNTGGAESPTGPGKGFVAGRSLTATKTDTPLIRTPQSISVVTSDEIKVRGSQSIGETLRYVAGVGGETNTANDTRCGGYQIRGFSSTGNTFYLNGLRLPESIAASFNCLEPYGAERIEILKGPASVLYGQNGPAGIINYVAKRPRPETFGEVSAIGGSFERVQGNFDFGGALTKDKTVLYRVTGVIRDGGNQIDFVRNRRQFIAPSVTWTPDADTSVTLLTNYQRERSGWGLQFLPASGVVFPNQGRTIPISRFVGEPGFDAYNIDQFSLGYQAEHRVNNQLLLRQNASYNYLHNQQYAAFGGTSYADPATGLYNRYVGYGGAYLRTFAIDSNAELKVDTGALRHTLLGGIDYRGTSYFDNTFGSTTGPINVFNPVYGQPFTSPFTLQLNNRVNQTQLGFYGQDQIRIDRFTFVVAGRYDRAQTGTADGLGMTQAARRDGAFTGKGGVIYNFDNGLAPYFSYSTSFLPTINVGPDGALFKPETGEQYEVGVKYQPPGWNAYVTFAAFDLTRQNAIRPTPVVFTATQTGEINSRGIEVEYVASLTDGLNARLGYALLDTQITKDIDPTLVGKIPTLVPRNRLSAWADYTIQTGFMQGIGAGGGIRYVGSTPGDDQNTFRVPAATVFDAAVFFKRGRYELAVNGSNVFNKQYVASCFNGDFGCFYAEGRKVLARGTYRW